LLADSASGFIVSFNGGFLPVYSIVSSLLADSASGFIVILMAVSACFIALPSVVGGFCLCSLLVFLISGSVYSIDCSSLLADSASGFIVLNGGFCLFCSIVLFVVGGFCLWVQKF
jgi:hypothetical protein